MGLRPGRGLVKASDPPLGGESPSRQGRHPCPLFKWHKKLCPLIISRLRSVPREAVKRDLQGFPCCSPPQGKAGVMPSGEPSAACQASVPEHFATRAPSWCHGQASPLAGLVKKERESRAGSFKGARFNPPPLKGGRSNHWRPFPLDWRV